MSTRQGGVSQPPFDQLNLRPPGLPGPPQGLDASEAVHENQRRFAQALGATPVWLNQVHGREVLRLEAAPADQQAALPVADASVTRQPSLACTVLVADCLPVLLCSRSGRVVGAAHAGWRGLAAGVLDATIAAMCADGPDTPADLMAWLGPCIGPQAFEVGAEVLQAFGTEPAPCDAPHFRFAPRPDGDWRWQADLPGLARVRLAAAGVSAVYGGAWCTVSAPSRFFSFRHQPRTGRMAAAIAIAGR